MQSTVKGFSGPGGTAAVQDGTRPFLQAPTRSGYGFGASITTSGFLTLPLTLGMLLTGLTTVPLARRLPTKVLMVLGAVPPVGL